VRQLLSNIERMIQETLNCYSCHTLNLINQSPHNVYLHELVIKEILGKPGIDISVFKAHSVRGTSSTAASAKGVLIEDILHTADWSTDCTFQHFYYCPVQANNYALTLLQPRTVFIEPSVTCTLLDCVPLILFGLCTINSVYLCAFFTLLAFMPLTILS